MKKICKLLSFLLICTLGATVLSGCGEKNNVATTTNEAYVMDKNLNPPGEFPVCKEMCIRDSDDREKRGNDIVMSNPDN